MQSIARALLSHSTEAGGLDFEFQQSEARTLAESKRIRPTATTRKYESYQKEFKEWCSYKNCPDNETVHGAKLHLFLQEQVLNRRNKKMRIKLLVDLLLQVIQMLL